MTSILACLAASAALYTLHRAAVLRIEYHDGYAYLMNARALLGDPVAQFAISRPPFLTLAQLPAAAIAGAAPPCSLVRLVAPHFTSAVLSLATAAAVFWALRAPLGITLAMLGTTLFVATPFFVRYGAHALADLPAAGWAASVVALYGLARRRPSGGAYGLCGLALGCAVLTKYPLAFLGPVLVATELVYAIDERGLDFRRWAGLVWCGSVAAALFVGAILAILAATSHESAREAVATLRTFQQLTSLYGAMHHESWRDYGPMAVAMVSPPTLLLAALGIAVALLERDARDVPFLGWLLVLGGGAIVAVRHTEARYLLPVVPAIVYFSARGAGHLLTPRRSTPAGAVGAAVVTVLVGWAACAGIHRALLDRDPVFRSDVELRTAELLLRARRPGGRLIWIGTIHAFHTRVPAELPDDEMFDVFHYPPFAVAYFTGEAVVTLGDVDTRSEAFFRQLLDGDAILRAADRTYETKTIPPGGVPPPELWKVRRLALEPAGGPRLVAVEDPSVRLRLRETDGRLWLSPEGDFGTWTILARGDATRQLRSLGEFELRRGEDIWLPPVPALSPVALLRIERMPLDPEVASSP